MPETPNTATSTAGTVVTVDTGYGRQAYIHKDIRLISEWGKPDDKYFSRFKFAINPADGSFLLLVTLASDNVRVVPFSSSAKQNISAIYSACSKGEPLRGSRRPSLAADLTSGFDEEVQTVVERWNGGEFISHSDFIRSIAAHVPHLMLKNLKWMVGFHRETASTDKEEGDEAEERRMKRPAFLELVEPGKDVAIRPVEFLVLYAAKFVGIESMQAPVPIVYSNDRSIPAMRYLDLETICRPGECPTWDGYMRRYRNDHGEAFMAFIFSLFDSENMSRQALSIVDNGYTAKSFVMYCLFTYLGTGICAALQKGSLDNQFAMSKVWDKRLVVFSDNKNKNILRTEKMHMITSGDFVEVEMKGKNSFPYKLQCKVIICGNTPLEINPDATHETSRLIQITTRMTDDMLKEFCMLDEHGELVRRPDGRPIPKGDPGFKDRLVAEFPQFLWKCREVYSRLCPNRADIIISDEMYMEMQSLASTEETDIGDFFERNFEYDSEHVIPWIRFKEIFRERSFAYCGDDRKCSITIDDLKVYVAKRFGINSVVFNEPRRVGGKSVRVLKGLRALTKAEADELDRKVEDTYETDDSYERLL